MTLGLKKGEWLVYAAFLPAFLTVIAIGITAAISSRNQAPWHVIATSTIQQGTDDYVQGLAKLGIAKLPGYVRSKLNEFDGPAIAAQ